jgi:hydroxymethylpyrimidine/phosphomethylpyrimidine kinase
MKYPVLSIAGFDGSGGAGLQADLKTFAALGCYGLSVLTALPIQNMGGVRSCYAIPPQAIHNQLDCLFDELRPRAIKIGMLFTKEIISLVAAFLRRNAQEIPLVIDPVMLSTSGHPLLRKDAIQALKEELFPLATLVTPNLPEAYALTNSQDSMLLLAKQLLDSGADAILIKGGHLTENISPDFYLHQDGDGEEFIAPRIDAHNTHGTGCTLSAAIAAGLAHGFPLKEACRKAKIYLTQALIAKGSGPIDHFHHLN